MYICGEKHLIDGVDVILRIWCNRCKRLLSCCIPQMPPCGAWLIVFMVVLIGASAYYRVAFPNLPLCSAWLIAFMVVLIGTSAYYRVAFPNLPLCST